MVRRMCRCCWRTTRAGASLSPNSSKPSVRISRKRSAREHPTLGVRAPFANVSGHPHDRQEDVRGQADERRKQRVLDEILAVSEAKPATKRATQWLKAQGVERVRAEYTRRNCVVVLILIKIGPADLESPLDPITGGRHAVLSRRTEATLRWPLQPVATMSACR